MDTHRIEKESFFQSRLARRVFINFIACALVPLIVMAVITFFHVGRQMDRQSRAALDREIKSLAMGLLERLNMQQAQLRLLAAHAGAGEPGASSPEHFARFQHWFSSAALAGGNGHVKQLFGRLWGLPVLSLSEQGHLSEGNVLATTQLTEHAGMQMLFALQLAAKTGNTLLLWAEIEPQYLWQDGISQKLPFGAHAGVFDADGHTLFSTIAFPAGLRQAILSGVQEKDRGNFEFTIEDDVYAVAYRAVMLKAPFMAPNWTVVFMQQKQELIRSIDDFRTVFLLAVLLVIGFVVMLSINLIRGSLVPLNSLIMGTRRIAQKDFTCRIEVASKDEFHDLAQSFNDMAVQLDRQFRTMSAGAEVDRAILSFLDTEKIVQAIFGGIHKIFPCDRIGIAVLDPDEPDVLQTYVFSPGVGGQDDIHVGCQGVDTGEIGQLDTEDEAVVVFEGQGRPAFLSWFSAADLECQAVLPVKIQNRTAAMIVLGYRRYEPGCREHFRFVRRMADHMAVALANAKLVSDLKHFNWGALHALARAVDAKSSWTAGHSERVAQVALRIGEAMGLDAEALDRMHRGALLHDLGKIGISSVILDKPGTLTASEFASIQRHPAIGARILEPIGAFSNLIPFVAQHHERFDGKGYPLGLAGDAIDPGARILAVADVFDALSSERPYRESWPMEKVIAIIKDGAGTQFDPDTVDAFIRVISRSRDPFTDKVRRENVTGDKGPAGALRVASPHSASTVEA